MKTNHDKLRAYSLAAEQLATCVLGDLKDHKGYITDGTVIAVNRFAKASEDVTALIRFLEPKFKRGELN